MMTQKAQFQIRANKKAFICNSFVKELAACSRTAKDITEARQVRLLLPGTL